MYGWEAELPQHRGQLWRLFLRNESDSYNGNTVPSLNDFLNISEITIDPADNQHIIGGSYGYGIAEFEDGELTDIIDETDGVLQPVPGYGHGYVRVTGVDFDTEGQLWVYTSNSDQPVYGRKPGSMLEPVQLTYNGFGITTNTGDILAGSTGQVWLLIESEGILVFQENQDGSMQERFFIVRNQVPDLLDRVYSVAEIRKDVWVTPIRGRDLFNPSEYLQRKQLLESSPKYPGTTALHLWICCCPPKR
jgi:hypothetical protein